MRALLVPTILVFSVKLVPAMADRPVPKPVWTVDGHKGGAYSVALGPDGRLMASGGNDGRVRVWSVAERKQLHAFDEGSMIPHFLVFSHDGKTLLVGSLARHQKDFTGDTRESKLTWYDLGTGRKVRVLEFEDACAPVLLSPDGTLLMTGSGKHRDFALKLREPATGKVIGELHPDGLRDMLFTPDSKRVLTTGYDGPIVVWDIATRERVQRIDLEQSRSGISAMALSASGKLLVVSRSNDEHIFIDLPTGKVLKRIKEPRLVDHLMFVSKDEWLLMGGWGLHVLNASKATVEFLVPVKVKRLAVSRDAKWLATVSRGRPTSQRLLQVWKLSDW